MLDIRGSHLLSVVFKSDRCAFHSNAFTPFITWIISFGVFKLPDLLIILLQLKLKIQLCVFLSFFKSPMQHQCEHAIAMRETWALSWDGVRTSCPPSPPKLTVMLHQLLFYLILKPTLSSRKMAFVHVCEVFKHRPTNRYLHHPLQSHPSFQNSANRRSTLNC